jgi:DNA-directed RNA polymerase specialized sigma subunit
MPLTATEVAATLGITPRAMKQVARYADVEPIHYLRENGKMVAVYADDVIERLARESSFGQLAADLGVEPERLASVILRHYAVSVAVPAIYRHTR